MKEMQNNFEELPEDMKKQVLILRKSKTKEECLKLAYDILTKKYQGKRFLTYFFIHRLFEKNIENIWKRNGFLHCTTMNYLLKTLLINSNFFKEKDIKFKWTLVWLISPHQYSQVNLGDKKINVDIWGANHGIKFGDYARGFH
jgi:hypothetical protein